jgi:hypothetical protein
MWTALYGEYPGSADRLTLDFVFTPKLEKIVKDDTAFLFDLKRVPGETLREGAVSDQVARQVLEARKLQSPVGVVKAQPVAQYKE